MLKNKIKDNFMIEYELRDWVYQDKKIKKQCDDFIQLLRGIDFTRRFCENPCNPTLLMKNDWKIVDLEKGR
jgi:hypothetical protein